MKTKDLHSFVSYYLCSLHGILPFGGIPWRTLTTGWAENGKRTVSMDIRLMEPRSGQSIGAATSAVSVGNVLGNGYVESVRTQIFSRMALKALSDGANAILTNIVRCGSEFKTRNDKFLSMLALAVVLGAVRRIGFVWTSIIAAAKAISSAMLARYDTLRSKSYSLKSRSVMCCVQIAIGNCIVMNANA